VSVRIDSFDDEPTTGGGYERLVVVPLIAADGIARRIVMRFRGRPLKRVSVVLEEMRSGERGVLMRYDDSHNRFHHHAPGWPEPGERIESAVDADVPLRDRAAFAQRAIRAQYASWEAEVFGQKGGDQV